ncbi:ABC transporter permease [Paenibacillaceae bacterium WGS1546]|uniref:ABC transporter permease n=1 Tax=Cohnella sp. WGS1546 TaxID=3366810 RepID=UPI00372D3B5A
MANYLKSEIYRLARKRALYVFWAVCALAPVLMTMFTAAYGTERYANTEFVFKVTTGSWSMIFFVVPVVVSLLLMDEFADGTLKNTAAYGISRSKVFYGKWILELAVLAVAWVVTYISLTASVFLLLTNNGTSNFTDFNTSILGVLPLTLAALAVSHCLCFLIENTLTHLVSYAVLIIVLPELYYLLAEGMPALQEIVNNVPLFPYAAANDLAWLKSDGMLLCWAVGMGYMLIAFLISSKPVMRKEYK